jgi:DNA invertase Pin-like site-specific DNA recombinase
VLAGLSRARAQGRKLGRPTKDVPVDKLASVEGFSVREAAARLGVSIATVSRWRAFQKTHGNPAV